jgi:hypothetical protein
VHSVPLLHPSLKLPAKPSSIWPVLDAMAIHLVGSELPAVARSIWPVLDAMAIHLPIKLKLPAIDDSIGPVPRSVLVCLAMAPR